MDYSGFDIGARQGYYPPGIWDFLNKQSDYGDDMQNFTVTGVPTGVVLSLAQHVQNVIEGKRCYAEAMAELHQFSMIIEEFGCGFDRQRKGTPSVASELLTAIHTAGERALGRTLDYKTASTAFMPSISALSNNEKPSDELVQFISFLIGQLRDILPASSRAA